MTAADSLPHISFLPHLSAHCTTATTLVHYSTCSLQPHTAITRTAKQTTVQPSQAGPVNATAALLDVLLVGADGVAQLNVAYALVKYIPNSPSALTTIEPTAPATHCEPFDWPVYAPLNWNDCSGSVVLMNGAYVVLVRLQPGVAYSVTVNPTGPTGPDWLHTYSPEPMAGRLVGKGWSTHMLLPLVRKAAVRETAESDSVGQYCRLQIGRAHV